MNALAQRVPALSGWRVVDWAVRAWRQFNWRHVLLAFALHFVRQALGPLGGMFLLPADPGDGWQPFTQFLDGSWLLSSVPIVYCVLVADKAYDDGVAPVRAYSAAVLAFSTAGPFLEWLLAGHFDLRKESTTVMLWYVLALLFQGGLGTSIYAYWRVTQRSTRRARAAEADRLHNEQRVQTARLLALQARVEPQMLFDALGRVAALHVRAPEAADALLADLIALLRAMQPSHTADTSTVEREFALVEAWIRVNRDGDGPGSRIRLQRGPESEALGIAPMLVLPLVKAVLASPDAGAQEWVLSARAEGPRLVVSLRASADVDVAGLSCSPELDALRDRMARLFGRSGGLSVLPHASSLSLDLPRLQEDSATSDPIAEGGMSAPMPAR
jgi:hypothetical protein